MIFRLKRIWMMFLKKINMTKQTYLNKMKRQKEYYIENKTKIINRNAEYRRNNPVRYYKLKKRIIKNCVVCGKIFETSRQWITCSVRCSRKNWKKNNPKKIKEERKQNRGKYRDRGRGKKRIELIHNPFPEEIPVDYHHINNNFVIPLPKLTHQKVLGILKKHLEYNKKMISVLYNMDIDLFLTGESCQI